MKAVIITAALFCLAAVLSVSSQSLEGTWSLAYLAGLEDEFDRIEAEYAAKDEKVLWGEPNASGLLKLSYDYKALRRQTWITLNGSNPHVSIYDGNINNGIETLKFKEAWPPTLRYMTSQVLLPSGEKVPKAPAPIEVATLHYSKLTQNGIGKTDISENGNLLTLYNPSNEVIARFKRVEAAQ